MTNRIVDKLINLLLLLFSHLEKIFPWIGKKVNKLMINSMVNVCRHRPHPWSTVHDYVSWTSLTDQSWSARHLPAYYTNTKLPDVKEVALLFDRKHSSQLLCDKSTCLFPAFAQYLTDGFIRTRMPNTSAGEKDDPLRRKNTSNHQIDLCTLYGRTQAQTIQLRLGINKEGYKGQLKSQDLSGEEFSPFFYESDGVTPKKEFSDLDLPLGIDKVEDTKIKAKIFAAGGDRVNNAPQVAMINTLFLREHNRLAKLIELKNPNWDDERVFQTTRNCVIVMFIKIVVEEYINHISPTLFKFRADPSVAWDAPWNKPNWITTEFSLLYRWHSLIPDQITWNDVPYCVSKTLWNNQLLIDNGLVDSFLEASSQRAAKLGALNTNIALLTAEEKAIEQGRLCCLDTYASYRDYVSLPKTKSFSDISKNKVVCDILACLYSTPADIEFYVGLFAEDKVENSPLPPLILRMVAVDAFSQALTNPLLSKHVYNESTFSRLGLEAIDSTSTLSDVLSRNANKHFQNSDVGMTQKGWKYKWI